MLLDVFTDEAEVDLLLDVEDFGTLAEEVPVAGEVFCVELLFSADAADDAADEARAMLFVIN